MRCSFLFRKQQLPYEGKLSARSNRRLCNGINFALLEEAGQKSEGKLILAALTGGRLVKKRVMPLLPSLQGHGQSLDNSPRKRNEIDVKRDGGDKVTSFEKAVTVRSGSKVLFPDSFTQYIDLLYACCKIFWENYLKTKGFNVKLLFIHYWNTQFLPLTNPLNSEWIHSLFTVRSDLIHSLLSGLLSGRHCVFQ
jgi:hypothetical protein